MSEIRYDLLVEKALRGVIRSALQQVALNGLQGDHHFYITFDTHHEGVEIPTYLRAQYKDEMTIVLQHQYYGLEVDDDKFAVTLSFNSKHERLVVPFASINTFADPAVNFALQLQTIAMDGDDPDGGEEASGEDGEKKDEEERGQVISLDSFRKKP
ncbi:MAG: SspB family protein [Bdellovibrionales bacterium]